MILYKKESDDGFNNVSLIMIITLNHILVSLGVLYCTALLCTCIFSVAVYSNCIYRILEERLYDSSQFYLI